MILKRYLFALFLIGTLAAEKFTLLGLQTLSKTYPEDAKPDNNNFDNLDFSSFFKQSRSSIADFFFKSQKHFPLTYFIELLEKVTLQQKKRNHTGSFILATQVKKNDKMVIFGSIQGAFHSLIRDLQELKKQGIIDESLKIIDPHYYILFNGSVIARSAYGLQTLFVILLLMEQNPDKVFYLKSDYDQDELWLDGELIQQLDIIYRKSKNKVIALLKRFITILPSAFYVNYKEDPHNLLKITALQKFNYDTHENKVDDFFYTLKNNTVSMWNLKKNEPGKFAYTTILIQNFDPTIKMQNIKPLMLLEPVGAATVWRIFSAPTTLFNSFFKVTDDAFAVIIFGSEIASSFIELFARNRFTQDTFKMVKSFEINVGIEMAATQENLNFAEKKIYIGSSLDLSKSNFIMGDRVRTGILLAIKNANKSPEMKGREIKDVILDDEYTPYVARKNIQFFKERFNIDTLLLPIGTPTVLSVKDSISSGELLAAFPITGSQFWRKPETKGVINFRPTYELEVEKLINYLINEYSFKLFAFFYQNDEYGIDCMNKAREVLKKRGINKWVEIPYERNTTNFSKHLELFKNSNIEALGCFSAAQPTQAFLKQLGAANLFSVKVFANAFVVDDVFESFVKNELGIQCLFSRLVPNPKLSTLDLVAEYRRLMDEEKKPYDTYSLEGYICASLLCEMIKQSHEPITHTLLLKKLEALNNYNFKGLTLNFDPQDRQISKRIWFDFQDDNDWLEVV